MRRDSAVKNGTRGGAVGLLGFTLVEILIVLVILGIASVAVIPHLSSRDDLKAASAARLVMADLIYAQNRAIAMQRMHYVEFIPDQREYRVMTMEGGSLQAVEHPITKTAFVVNLGGAGTRGLDGIELVSASFDGKGGVAFDELGTPFAFDPSNASAASAMSSGQIEIRSGSYTLAIKIEPYTGEIGVERGAP